MRAAPKWLGKQAQHALLRHMERYASPRDVELVKLLLNTGLRVNELCRLTWQDSSVAARKGHLVIRQGKGHKYREVPLNKTARQALLNLGYHQYAGTTRAIVMGQRGALSPRGIQLGMVQIRLTPHCDTYGV